MDFWTQLSEIIGRILSILTWGGFIAGIVWLFYKLGKEAEEAYNRQQEEQERKRRAFEIWYESLPDAQKYIVDQQMAQARSIQAMQALMGFHIMHEMMHHDHHTDSHFPFL